MTGKELGKITHAEFGKMPDCPNYFGLQLSFKLGESSFIKGSQITSLDELIMQPYVFYDNGINCKLFLGAFIESWHFGFIWRLLKSGSLYKAIRKENNQ